MANVKDEPQSTPAEKSSADWLAGYESSTCESANAPNYPGNQVWDGIAASAEAYKAHWKQKPKVFPYGTNDEGGK